MASRHTLFRIFYRIGFTPWEGHSLGQALRDLVEGTGDTAALPTGSALDLGCGTGDSSIYLAQHGWKVTGVDFVAKPLDKARVKADAAKVSIDFVHADVTNLSQAGIGADFQLIIDNGCLHAMSDRDRDAYVRETSALAAPDAHLVIEAFIPGGGSVCRASTTLRWNVGSPPPGSCYLPAASGSSTRNPRRGTTSFSGPLVVRSASNSARVGVFLSQV